MAGRYWKDKKVLITGFEGFLGSNLARALLGRGAYIIGADKIKDRRGSVLEGLRDRMVCVKGDISDLNLVKGLIDRHRPRVIFHLAAEAIVVRANRYPVTTFKSNIEGTWNILEASKGKKFIEVIVAASSDKAYGKQGKTPYKEGDTLKGDHPYDVSKSCADLICYAYWNTYKTPVCVMRCGNIYGPGDLNFSRIVPDAIRCALRGRQLMIRSDGKFVRDYVYVDDVVNGYITLAEKMGKLRLHGEAFNLSSGRPVTVMEMVKTACSLAGERPNYKILDEARCEIRHQHLDSAKARRMLGWKPSFGLKEGLRRTIGWYRDNLAGMRK